MELSQVRRIIFVAGNGISRAPMAAGILSDLLGEEYPIEILARGLVVAFPEPLNQKTEAVLAGKESAWRVSHPRNSRMKRSPIKH